MKSRSDKNKAELLLELEAADNLIAEFMRVNDRLHFIFNNLSEAVYLLDSKGRIKEANQAACKDLGRPRPELLGRLFAEVDPDCDEQALADFWSGASEGQPVRGLRRHVRKDGTTFPVEMTGLFFREKGEQLFYCIARNMSEQIEARAMVESLAKFPSENPNPVFRADPDGVPTYANQAAEQVLRQWRRSKGEPLPSDIRRLISASLELGKVIQADQAVGDRTFHFQVSPVPGDDYVNIYALDVTDRVRAVEALRRSEAMLKEVSRVARIGGWEHDLETGKAVWTSETYRIVDIPEGRTPPGPSEHLDYYHPEDRPKLEAAIHAAVRDGTSFDLELRCRTASGRSIWSRAIGYPVFKNGRCVKIFGAFQDITERKRGEEALRESERRFRTVVAKVPCPLVITNQEQNIEFYNESFIQTFGYTLEDVRRAAEWWEQVYPDPEYRAKVRDDWEKAVAQSARDGLEIPPQEWRMRCKDGSYKDVDFRMVNLGDVSVIAMVDLTSFRSLEADLRSARDAAEGANKAKSEFLANMSHEIRTPLNGIMGMLQLMRYTGLDTSQSEYVEASIQSCKRLTRLLADILDLSKVEAGRLEIGRDAFDFADVLNSVRQLFHPAADQKRLELAVTMDPSIPRILVGDGYRLRQVLNNLVGNAMKFTDFGGVSLDASDPGLGTDDGFWVRIVVADTGIGIAEEDLGGLFTAFSQVDKSMARSYQGAGLGLHISKRLVKLMGGTIDVASTKGQGTVFTLELPFGLPESGLDAPAPPESRAEGGLEGRTVLLAEDDHLSQVYVSKLLRHFGCGVHVVEDGDQAVRALEENDYDAVLMDVQMPGVDGIEATRRIRNSATLGPRSRVPIVAFTAYAMNGDRERFLAEGMDGYLAKPVEAEALKELLLRLVGKEEKGS